MSLLFEKLKQINFKLKYHNDHIIKHSNESLTKLIPRSLSASFGFYEKKNSPFFSAGKLP